MPRFLTVGAAQMGPVGQSESRAAVVLRLLEMMREAKGRGCDLVVFTECALTPFFPRQWEEDARAFDVWFEREMPGPDTEVLFHEARKLGIGFHLGYAELAEVNGQTRRYNSSVLVGTDGEPIGKYRKIHLPGATAKDADNPHRTYEKRYFDVGNLGFRAWRAFGGVVGLCLGNDRRWPETYRVLGLYGAEMIILGYNTTADHPDHPELDYLTNFHSMISMQSGAYQNGCFVVGVAKAGHEAGINQIGRSVIIAPSGEVVTQCTTLKDELVVHRCNLDHTRFYKDQLFQFAESRRIEAYSLMTKTKGPVPPFEPGQDFDRPAIEEAVLKQPMPVDSVPAETEVSSERPAANSPADPVQAIREVLKEEYQYSDSQIEPITAQVVRALELKNAKEAEAKPEPPKPDAKPKTLAASDEPLTQADPKPVSPAISAPLTEVVPASDLPVADDIGWLPGRFAAVPESTDRVALAIQRLMKDYRYSEEQAQKIAELAETAWQQKHSPEEPPASEPVPTTVYVPEVHSRLEAREQKGKPPTQYGSSPMEMTFPALSSEAAFHVFSILTQKYGYSARSARGIAERASSASRRWQSAKEEAQAAPASPPKEAAAVQLPPTVVTEPPPETPSPIAADSAKIEPPPESTDGPYIVVPCPECEFPLKFSQSHAALLGRKARCPKCQTKFRLPESV